MNKLVILMAVSCFCAMLAESFLLSHKFKDGCDPNPCQHKSTCKLNPTNKNLSTCTCTPDYHGKHCELEVGCKKSPCKNKAICTNGVLNKSEYHCKCGDGYVGKNCDKKNYCELKNPCKNGGKCTIDKISGDPHCDCKPGWAPKHCEKLQCNITEYKMKQTTKKSAKLFIDHAIEAKVKALDDLAKLCKIHLHIVKSFVMHPDKAKANTYDIKDKTNSHHYIGHAVGFNVHDMKDNLLCNDVCLSKVPCPVSEAKCFLDGLYAIKWKWSILDSTTAHTDFQHANGIIKYNNQREAVQVGCTGKKFV